ncbi:MAG TPA: PmoA family protein [Tepidisphaeraceae bacterium]
MILTHTLGTSLSLGRPGAGLPLWTYVYGGKPKPFFHPLTTPAGHCLTLFEPSDHVWHRGLWYAIKFVNGQSFWEENDSPYNTQRTTAPPDVTHDADAVRVTSTLEWTQADGTVVIDETRTFTYCPLDQDAYTLDFTFRLTPRVDVTFDRTAFNGTWGGYGGLTFRGNRNWLSTRLLFDDNTTSDRPTPKVSKWCDLTGLIDGGPRHHAGIAVFDHPANPRHPTPWYGGTGQGHYFNAAFLFNESLKWEAARPLEQEYRVLVHDHAWDADRLNAAWAAWAD